MKTQRLAVALTPLDKAIALLLDQLKPVLPVEVPLAEAIGGIAAEMPVLRQGLPLFDIAIADGWALSARELVGASSYSPLPLVQLPIWVEAGERMPEGCDCVVDADLIDQSGPISQMLAEAAPGQGVRRAGQDIAAGHAIVVTGRKIGTLDLAVAQSAGLETLAIRRPRLHVIDVPATDGNTIAAQFIATSAKAAGARVTVGKTDTRDAAAIVRALEINSCDLLVMVGGTGTGRKDATVDAIAAHGEVFAHGLALQPGRTAAIGRIGSIPVIAVPGGLDQALAVWLALIQPALDRLSGRLPQLETIRTLERKIASGVGIAEITLLKASGAGWMPLATGDLSLDNIASADVWLIVPGGSEGYAAGSAVGAFPLREPE